MKMPAGLTAAGRRLFTDRRPAWPLAIARILIGLTICFWSITMLLDVPALLGENALLPPELVGDRFRWIDLDTSTEIRLALAALLLASVAIIAGWKPTVWLIVAFVLLVAVQRRNPLIINSGDVILRNLTLFLAFTPTGAALSFDRYRRLGRDGFFSSGMVAPWGMRLVQLQVMVVYLFAFWSKSGEQWREGIAVSTALRLEDLQRVGQFDLLVENVWIVAALTWGTLLVELMLGTLLWYKPLRPLLIVLGVLLHVAIDGLLLVGFFGVGMIAGLMTFLDADEIDQSVRERRRRHSAAAADGSAPDEAPDAGADGEIDSGAVGATV
jgi:hypothetical protein